MTVEMRAKDMSENESKKQKQRCDEDSELKNDLPEENYWLKSLERSFYTSLPVWIQGALLFNLAEQFGIWTFHNILQCRLISYIFLPYTLPAVLIISFIYRLLCWLKQTFYHAVSSGRKLKKDMTVHLRFIFNTLRRLLPNRFPSLISMFALFPTPWACLQPLAFNPLSALPSSWFLLFSFVLRYLTQCIAASTPNNKTEHEGQMAHLSSRQRSICFQFSGFGEKGPDDIGDANPPSSTFFFQVCLELEMLQKDKLDFERRLRNTERDENLACSCISNIDVQEVD